MAKPNDMTAFLASVPLFHGLIQASPDPTRQTFLSAQLQSG